MKKVVTPEEAAMELYKDDFTFYEIDKIVIKQAKGWSANGYIFSI